MRKVARKMSQCALKLSWIDGSAFREQWLIKIDEQSAKIDGSKIWGLWNSQTMDLPSKIAQ